MKNPADIARGFRHFFDEVVIELKKCAWPSKQELMESTVMVIVASLILGGFVGISDFFLIELLSRVIR